MLAEYDDDNNRSENQEEGVWQSLSKREVVYCRVPRRVPGIMGETYNIRLFWKSVEYIIISLLLYSLMQQLLLYLLGVSIIVSGIE